MTIMYCTGCGTLAQRPNRNLRRFHARHGAFMPVASHPALRPRLLFRASFPLRTVLEWPVSLALKSWL